MDDDGLIVDNLEELEEDAAADATAAPVDPDEFFAKNAFRIVYQTNNFFLPQIWDLIDKGEVLNLRPEYQRRLRWSTPQKSRLIESLLLYIPIPPVFLYESDAARYEVMQQRLNSVTFAVRPELNARSIALVSPRSCYCSKANPLVDNLPIFH
jgi:hypothetical protein